MSDERRRETWASLPRQSKLAACMFPDKVPEHIKAEMQAIARFEGKVSPLDAKARAEQARKEQQSPHTKDRRW
jgi:hypothetical protein